MYFAPYTRMSILTPHWFDDSVQVGCRVPEIPYLWPDPEVLRPGVLQVTMGHDIIGIAEASKVTLSHSNESVSDLVEYY